MRRTPLIVLMLLIWIIPATFNSCTNSTVITERLQGTTGGNPLIELYFDAYTAGAGTTRIAVCPTSVEIATGTDTHVQALAPLDVELSSSGGTFGSVRLPPGSYVSLLVHLSERCASGRSLQVTNSSGNFSTAESFPLRFTGQVDVTGALRLRLQTQLLVNEAGAAASDADLFARAETVEQTFTADTQLSCPAAYILVPPLAGYTTQAFCVSKYEARQSGSAAFRAPRVFLGSALTARPLAPRAWRTARDTI